LQGSKLSRQGQNFAFEEFVSDPKTSSFTEDINKVVTPKIHD
jgi:hypothetical protein